MITILPNNKSFDHVVGLSFCMIFGWGRTYLGYSVENLGPVTRSRVYSVVRIEKYLHPHVTFFESYMCGRASLEPRRDLIG